MFWLRLLAIIAAASTFPYFYFQPEPLWSALFWQSCFLGVNLLNFLLLLYGMRSTSFDDDEQAAYELKFSNLKPQEARNIFRHAASFTVGQGKSLLEDGQKNQTLYLILSGECLVLKNGAEVARLGAGDLVGELSFVSGHPASADVQACSELRMMAWEKHALGPLFKNQGIYEAYFLALCSTDVAEKLRAATRSHASVPAFE